MTGRRVFASATLALMLAGCGGRVVPVTTGRAPVADVPRGPARPVPRPVASGQVIAAGRAFDGRIQPAVPLPAAAVAINPAATTAATAGVVPGPPLATLPIDEAQA